MKHTRSRTEGRRSSALRYLSFFIPRIEAASMNFYLVPRLYSKER
jgi:hypothetical protein